MSEGAVSGWGSTPTGETSGNSETPRQNFFITRLARGWQRTALYAILVTLIILVFLNIALTLWIIACLRLSGRGIGPIDIISGGIKLDGNVLITDRLITSSINSRPGQSVNLNAHRNFSIFVTDQKIPDYSQFILKRDSVKCGGHEFEVVDSQGKSVFKASREEVKLSADVLTVDGEGGISVQHSVQTPDIKAPPGHDLQLESQTRRLDLRAPQSINFESRAGTIDIISYNNINMESVVGALKIDAANIYIPKLKEAFVTKEIQNKKHVKRVKVYQMCACASGKLFLSAPEGNCSVHEKDIDVCR